MNIQMQMKMYQNVWKKGNGSFLWVFFYPNMEKKHIICAGIVCN